MRIRFKPNPFLGEPYLGQVVFYRYGEVRELDDAVAKRLLMDHPYAFEDADKANERVLLKRLMDGVNGEIKTVGATFSKPGDVRWVNKADAMSLFRSYPSSFEVVELEETTHLPLRERILLALGEQPYTLSETGGKLGVSWRKLVPEVNKLIKEGFVEKTDDKPAKYVLRRVG